MKRFALLTLSIALAACARQPQETPETPTTPETPAAPQTAATPGPAPGPAATALDVATLGGHHWKLDRAVDAKGQRLEALFVRADQPVQLDFRDGRVNVSNTCNRMGGRFTLEGTRLTIGDLASTLMACTDPKLMALDGAVGKALQAPLTAALQAGATPMLTLTSPAGDALTFRGEPTAETRFGGPGETVFLEIAPQSKPCTHPLVPNRQCLQVREVHFDDKGLRTGEQEGWQPLYQDIEGFDHVEGTRNVVRLKRYTMRNPPADASSVAYVLDMVVESEDVSARR